MKNANLIGGLFIISIAFGLVMADSSGILASFLGDYGDYTKTEYGTVYVEKNIPFTFHTDADGSSIYIVDIHIPDGKWERLEENGVSYLYDSGDKITKNLNFELKDRTSYKYPLGTYTVYAGFYDCDTPYCYEFTDIYNPTYPAGQIPTSKQIAYTQSFSFDIVSSIVCTEGDRICTGQTVQECVNNQWTDKQGCSYECIDNDDGNAYCASKPIVCGDGSCKYPEETTFNCPKDCINKCSDGDDSCIDGQYLASCQYVPSTGIYDWVRIYDCGVGNCVNPLIGISYCNSGKCFSDNDCVTSEYCNDLGYCEEQCELGEAQCSIDASNIEVCKSVSGNNVFVEITECSEYTSCVDTIYADPQCLGQKCSYDEECDDNNIFTIDSCSGTIDKRCTFEPITNLIIGFGAIAIFIGGIILIAMKMK